MFATLARLPLLVIVIGISAIGMLLPAAYASGTGDTASAQSFFLWAALSGLLSVFIAIAMAGQARSERPRRHLQSLLVLYFVLPLLLAVPFHQAVPTTTYLNAYVEMVSSLTTTGATLFEDTNRLPNAVHLWRAAVAWLGGLFMWVAAIAVLAPMSLGGFEVRARRASAFSSNTDKHGSSMSQITHVADLSQRLRTYAAQLFPVYLALTATLWLLLIIAGEGPFVALNHAMSTLSSSGISPVGGPTGGTAGYGGEVLMFGFFIFAISRITFTPDVRRNYLSSVVRDREIRIAAALVILVPLFLFGRHFLGAVSVNSDMSIWSGLMSLWGSVFTVLSFLTTTGFESAAWEASQDWSGLGTPGLILLGLAIIGGGVATTAGGVKLLRVYALAQHGRRELEKLVHPHSVAGAGGEARHLRRRGAYMAWVFFMLMTLSIAGVMAGFSFTGETFEQAIVLTVAALTTTGPLAAVAGADPILYGALSLPGKAVLTVAMVLGRLETIAIVALLGPDVWRRR